MTERKRIERLATKVMGWSEGTTTIGPLVHNCWLDENSSEFAAAIDYFEDLGTLQHFPWNPLRNANDAMMVVDRLIGDEENKPSWKPTMRYWSTSPKWRVDFLKHDGPYVGPSIGGSGDTLELAICEAAEKVVRYLEDE